MIESLDTSILVRLITGDIPHQCQKARHIINRPVNYHVADIAIVELVYVLENYYHYDRAHINEALFSIIDLPNIKCNRALFQSALPIYLAHPKLSFVDCCLTEYARLKQSEPLWTFDKKLAMQSGTAKEP
ncbi:MAG: PIN domain-containing protein [Candidatus Nomurabacteria bacterium]|jgi:predicted nucleic-acid-binding protein|nr:PIN domain-containing protein [Candidatus Nomurabacteria bacterium]